MKLQRIKIRDLGKIVTGNTPPRKEPDYYGTAYPFIKPTDIELDSRFTYNPEECYSEKAFEKYKNSLIPKGSTCVVTIGSIGKKITMAHTDCFINQAMNAVIPYDNFDKHYVFYLLKYNLYKVKALDSGTSSGRENVSKSSFGGIEVDVCLDKGLQKEIGEILCAYDDLIENNQRRSTLLEEAAQCLYRLMNRAVGENYTTRQMDEICKVQGGGTPSTKVPLYWQNPDVLWFTPTDLTSSASTVLLNSEKKISQRGLKESSAKLFPPKTIMMTSRASIGYFGIINQPSSTNQGFINIIPNEEYYRYFLLFNLRERKDELIANANGSTFLEISKTNFRRLTIKIPNDESRLKAFEVSVQRYFDFEENLLKQNLLLRQARDILLPRLMNGEIDLQYANGVHEGISEQLTSV